MAKNKIGMTFKGLEEMMTKVDKLGGNLTKIASNCLEDGAQVVSDKLVRDTVKTNMPARGHYSSDNLQTLRRSIRTKQKAATSGTKISIDVGYDFKISGLKSIFLMYGTPKMKPARKIKSDIYGSATIKEVKAAEQETLNKAVKRIMGG